MSETVNITNPYIHYVPSTHTGILWIKSRILRTSIWNLMIEDDDGGGGGGYDDGDGGDDDCCCCCCTVAIFDPIAPILSLNKQ